MCHSGEYGFAKKKKKEMLLEFGSPDSSLYSYTFYHCSRRLVLPIVSESLLTSRFARQQGNAKRPLPAKKEQ